MLLQIYVCMSSNLCVASSKLCPRYLPKKKKKKMTLNLSLKMQQVNSIVNLLMPPFWNFSVCDRVWFLVFIIPPSNEVKRGYISITVSSACLSVCASVCQCVWIVSGRYLLSCSSFCNQTLHGSSNAKNPLAELEKCRKRWVSHFE